MREFCHLVQPSKLLSYTTVETGYTQIQKLIVILIIACIRSSNAVNFDQCLKDINNMTIDGKTDNHGHPLPPSTRDASAITYELCISQCGAGQEPFQWTMFSQEFSSWLLPWLALLSQLPFGANDKLHNLESMLLTLGSPTLAAYSLVLTVLNRRWIAQLFSNYRYANVQSAVRVLSSLQQSPLRVDADDELLASLVLLPQNDEWWTELVVWLDYTHTWSISAAASIAWVIMAYIFTIVDYFSQSVLVTLDSNVQGIGSVGSLWLWLLPIVVGWLQISPKCDSNRLNQAFERANAIAFVATSISPPRKASEITERRAISLKLAEVDEARLDERATPPIFNYARFLPWVHDVMVISDIFHNVSERNHHHDPVIGVEWCDRKFDDGSQLTAFHVSKYCVQREGSDERPKRKWGLDDSVISRVCIASVLALMLQWGTTIAAVIIAWFTPTIGLGCRSGSYILYGLFSTLAWILLFMSSILTYYSTHNPARSFKRHSFLSIRSCLFRWLAIFLRRLGKLVATTNAVWVVSTGLLQFSSFYDRCYCNSSVLGLGKRAYNVINLTRDDAVNMRAAWIGGFSLAAAVAAIFAGFVTLLVDPPFPS
ncbi:hypothetical protein GALMADRAFT_77794 [Galerina marginata CBS 339.88]|uniref:Uncharacterized protein n=1 Tax=Galerina marginata (strain CBS 339.88) TaxID=685588 RepID=A0A067SDV6_GALM3|nr:hypothetical protein GALMADRAFT_77794 [Galerina marginata CBS 339.88]